MNILGIGPGPFVIIFLALLLFGPKKMVQYAYQAGRYVSQLRGMWEQTMQAVQKEFQDAGLDLPTNLNDLHKNFDIGAEAMKVINKTPEAAPAAPTVPDMPIPDAPTGSAPISDVSTSSTPSVSVPTMPPTDTQPSLNNPPDDESNNKKYDAWLPN